MVALIIHGGAGTFPAEHHDRAVRACERALAAGYGMLQARRSALDAVEEAVRICEDEPVFDAGRGSYPNARGEVEMDAIIVDGVTLKFGAVGAIREVDHPVSVARRVLEQTDHCLLAGPGAIEFAREQGFQAIPDEELRAAGEGAEAKGTVGAVALDHAGHIAAATSTGGVRGKMPGRIGDSAVIGSGALAEDFLGGVSSTGPGEAIMRVMLARNVAEYLKQRVSAMEASRRAVRELDRLTKAAGGVICVDASGHIGMAHTTEHMPYAFIDAAGLRQSGL